MTPLLDIIALCVVWVFYAVISAWFVYAAVYHTWQFIVGALAFVLVQILMGYIKKRNLLND